MTSNADSPGAAQLSEFAFFSPHLRRLSFKKTWSTNSGGVRMDEWKKSVADREITVQLWADGGHRVTHMVFTSVPGGGAETTTPTRFNTVEGLDEAVRIETTRQDNKYLHHEPTTDVVSEAELRELFSCDPEDIMPEDVPGGVSVCDGRWYREGERRWRFWKHREAAEVTP